MRQPQGRAKTDRLLQRYRGHSGRRQRGCTRPVGLATRRLGEDALRLKRGELALTADGSRIKLIKQRPGRQLNPSCRWQSRRLRRRCGLTTAARLLGNAQRNRDGWPVCGSLNSPAVFDVSVSPKRTGSFNSWTRGPTGRRDLDKLPAARVGGLYLPPHMERRGLEDLGAPSDRPQFSDRLASVSSTSRASGTVIPRLAASDALFSLLPNPPPQ